MPAEGLRLLGFGANAGVAAGVQDRLRDLGYRATMFALTDDAEGDSLLVSSLQADRYDGVCIGGFINGQSPGVEATAETTIWFGRVRRAARSCRR